MILFTMNFFFTWKITLKSSNITSKNVIIFRTNTLKLSQWVLNYWYFTCHYKQQGKHLFYIWSFIFTLLFQEKFCWKYSILVQLLLQAILDIFACLAHLNTRSKLMTRYMKLVGFVFLYIKPKIIFDANHNSRMNCACWIQESRGQFFPEAMKMLTCKM